MRVIHLLRKPLSEGTVAANVLRWGTGALNIDGSRIVANGDRANEHGGGQGAGQHDDGMRPKNENRTYGGTLGGRVVDPHPGGRWPANLVLQHLPECEQTGTREEAGYSVNRFTDGMKPFGEGAGHPYESVAVPPSTVAVWSCAHGCPVMALDAQSGGAEVGASRYFKQFGG